MAIQVTTITAPAYWASAFINGDISGMESDEIAAYEAFCETLDGWEIVSTEDDEDGNPAEPRFTWSFDLYGGTARGGEVLDYVALKHS